MEVQTIQAGKPRVTQPWDDSNAYEGFEFNCRMEEGKQRGEQRIKEGKYMGIEIVCNRFMPFRPWIAIPF
jgi:hypothetical protein